MRRDHLGVIAVFAVVSAFPLASQEAESDSLTASVTAVRNAGTVLISWVVANMDSTHVQSTDEASPAEYRWSSCPAISYDEARQLMDERWADKFLPTDGWGNELEFCLRSDDLSAPNHVVGVRSPGSDGEFDSDTYQPGPFALNEPTRDTVWIDGVFVAWPAIPELAPLGPEDS